MGEGEYTGIVLAGGKSSRMGMEKGLIKWKGRTLAEHALDTITPLCKEIIISSNGREYDYLGYPVINDRHLDCGPMGGILSCLYKSNTEINIIIAVDTPFIPTEIYKKLLQEKRAFDITLAQDHKSRYQPLCSLFNMSVIPVMHDQVDKKILGFYPLMSKCKYHAIPFSLEEQYYNEMSFFNINSPADLEALS